MTNKVRENRLRRVAERRGLSLRKSRRRDEGALDFATYQLVDAKQDTLVLGNSTFGGFGMSLDEVEEFLTPGRRQEFVVQEIGGKWVVVDRQLSKQTSSAALLSLVGSSRLAAGPFETEEEAQKALARIG